MDLASNHITTVAFNGGNYAKVEIDNALWQWDYGQVVRIADADIPEGTDVYISNEVLGETQIITQSRNEIAIPDEFLWHGVPISIYIDVFRDRYGGATEYRINIPVIKKAKPESTKTTEEPYEHSTISENDLLLAFPIAFNGGRYVRIDRKMVLWNGGVGKALRFIDVDLPSKFEVHVSNSLIGEAKVVIGSANCVVIPDECIKKGKPIFLWVFLHDTEDDGETVYRVDIPVC